MDSNLEGRLLAYLRARPDASHGDVSRAFGIRTSSAARFRKRFRLGGLLDETPDRGLNGEKFDRIR